MKHTISRVLVTLAIVAAGSGSLLAGFSGVASATSPAPWEPVGSPEVGNLFFFNSSGQQVTGGNLTDAPIAAYVEGTTTLRTGDTKATLKAYTPVSGQAVGLWSGGLLSATASTFPNTGAPANLATSGLPLYTGTSSDSSLSTYITSDPNTDTSTTDGYGGVYVLRLVTSGPGLSATATYDATDIQVTGSTWSVVYPAPTAPTTTTTLAESPSSPVVGNTAVGLTATVSPSTVAGSVQFLSGTTVLGTAPVSGGTANLSTSALPVGTDSLTAVFTPTPPGGFVLGYTGSTSSPSSYTVTQPPAANTVTALGVNPTTSQAFTSVALTATVTGTPQPGSGDGTVNFYDNGSSTADTVTGATLLGSGPVGSGGLATLNYSEFGTGPHNIVAQFEPTNSATFNVSTSLVVLYTATTPAAPPDVQNVEVTVPAGTITISTPYTSTSPLNLGTATIDSDDANWDASAPFGTTANGGVTITDTQNDDTSWTASVLASNFSTSGGTINGNDFSFTGLTATYPVGNALSGEVTVAPSGVGALGGTTSHPFASAAVVAPDTTVDGTVNIFGNINLVAPTSTPAGLYTGTLTFTVS